MSFGQLAKIQVDAMDSFKSSKKSEGKEERDVMLSKAASIYWRLGYYHRAKEMMDVLLKDSSNNVAGLLWGVQYNLQEGDTQNAYRFLERINLVDSANTVAISFEHLLRNCDSLPVCADDSCRSALHLSIGIIDDQIGLKEESIDECEKSLRYNPKNLQTLRFLGTVYEKHGALRTAERIYRAVLRLRPDSPDLLAHADSLTMMLEK
jgi:tetratricopeptide (TPR) repeat protein